MPITLPDALNLLPKSIRDDRGKNFIKLVYFMCCESDQITVADFLLVLIPYKLKQFGLGRIAGLAARLSAADQRQLLSEATAIHKAAGTPYSIKRCLELFGYPGTTFDENPIINGVKRWGEFGVIIQVPFNYAEVEQIINALKPPSRKLLFIRFVNAIQLNGLQLLNGTTIIEGLATEAPPIKWEDATTALTPVQVLTPVPDLTNASTNINTNFNDQLQALLNQIALEDMLLSQLATRVNALNTALSQLGGGSIAPQLATIAAKNNDLSNSNSTVAIALSNLTTPINTLVTKANNLETGANSFMNSSNGLQLDVTVQRQNAALSAIAALVPSGPFPTNKVLSTNTSSAIFLDNPPNLGAYIPEFANLEFKQNAGTNAGNYPTADVWVAMPFTVASNDNNFVTQNSTTRFVIPQGTYLITYNWMGCGCLGFGGRVWNVSNSILLEAGSPGLTVTGGGNIGDTWSAEGCLFAMFSIIGPTELEFQFRAKALHPSGAALTAGQSNSNPVEQIYQEVVILRMSNS